MAYAGYELHELNNEVYNLGVQMSYIDEGPWLEGNNEGMSLEGLQAYSDD